MKPAAFEYHRPESAAEAISLLDELGEEAKPLAGGQSLVSLMNMRLGRPEHLVDINRCAEMDYVRLEDGELRIGALARQRRVELEPAVGLACPLLTKALAFVGHPTIRNRGTICGSLAHADSAAEVPAVAVALGASLVARGAEGERVIEASQFFRGLFTTALAPGELLVEARFPSLQGWGTAFLEFARRHGDFAIAGVAVALRVEGGRVAEARLGLAGVASGPVRAVRAEAALAGEAPSPQLFREAAELAVQDCDPVADIHGSVSYRRQLVRVLVRRALEQVA